MSTVFAPKLELPRASTQQVNIGETVPSETAIGSNLIPNSITVPGEGVSRAENHEPAFGTHIREAVGIGSQNSDPLLAERSSASRSKDCGLIGLSRLSSLRDLVR